MHLSTTPSRLFAVIAAGLLLAGLGGCGGRSAGEGRAGLRLVSPSDAAGLIAAAPDDLVVLDIRTAAEFSEGHLEHATMLDFYAADFAASLGALDRDVPYVLYCRSGNRSAQAADLMAELGFTDVAEIDGGVLAWSSIGLPLVGG